MTNVLPTPDPPAAITYLQELDANGWHTLVAIAPDETTAHRTTARTFRPGDWLEMQRWLAKHNGSWNIYYQLNEPVAGARHSKLTKAEIGHIRAIYVDLDPRGGPDELEAERQRLLALADAALGDMIAPPTFVVDSGGGIQLVWKLEQKLPAAQFAAWAEAQSNALAEAFNGDHVYNVDRIFRLPGTINIPTAAKRAKGRQPALAQTIGISGATYSQKELASWTPPKMPDTAAAIELPPIDMTEVVAADAYDQLPPDLKERFEQELARNGELAALWRGLEPPHDTSRSGWAFALATHLRRSGRFSPTEYAQLAWVWDVAQLWTWESRAQYQLQRAWARNPGVSALEEFPPLDDTTADAILTDRKATSIPPIAERVEPITEIDLSEIRPREWLFGKFLARRYLSMLISPPGVGKTTFFMQLAIAMATGRDDIAGFHVPRRCRVIYHNQEDERDELKLRAAAVMAHYGIRPAELTGDDGRSNLWISSGAEHAIVFSAMGRDGRSVQRSKDADAFAALVREIDADAVILDPLVELHTAEENDNTQMSQVARIFREMAVEHDVAVALAHHTRKPPTGDSSGHYGQMDSGRGAGSPTGVARFVYTLYGLDSGEAKARGVPDDERHLYIRLDGAKANLALLEADPRFFKRTSVMLPNGSDVGVLVPVVLEKKKSPEQLEVERLVADVLAVVDGANCMSIGDIADELIGGDPLYADRKPGSLRRAIERTFANPAYTSLFGVYRLSDPISLTGRRGRHRCLIAD